MRYNLRLLTLGVVLTCTTLAWRSYVDLAERYDSRVDRANVAARLESSQMRVESIKQQLAGDERKGSRSWEAEALPYFEVEQALCRLEMAGYATRRGGFHEIEIEVGGRTLSESQIDELYGFLRLLRNTPQITVTKIDLQLNSNENIGTMVRDIKSMSPWTEVRR